MKVWEIDIHPACGFPDRESERVVLEAEDLGWPGLRVRTARGYLLEGDIGREEAEELGRQLLADPVVERFQVADDGRPVPRRFRAPRAPRPSHRAHGGGADAQEIAA